MAARNKYWEILKEEWIENRGKIVYEEGEVIVIRKDDEFLIKYGEILIHVMRDVIAARVNGRWLVSRAPRWRGQAIMIVRRLRHKIPMVPIP